MSKQSASRPKGPGEPIMPPELRVSDRGEQSPMARAATASPGKRYVWGGIPGPVIGAPGTIAQRELAEEGSE